MLTHINVKEGFANGFVADSDVDKVLELHGQACLTDCLLCLYSSGDAWLCCIVWLNILGVALVCGHVSQYTVC